MEKYTPVKELGRGTFGVVSVVSSSVDGRTYVLKQIDLTKLDESVKRAALNEAQLLSSLSHPCIVGYIESFLCHNHARDDPNRETPLGGMPLAEGASEEPDGDTLCIVMEHCAGGDVSEVIRKAKLMGSGPTGGPPFSEDQILDWFVQLALALKYTHGNHVIHRDIKAQNVFLTSDSKVKLGDFGISKVLNSEADFARTVLGTPYSLSPEICEGKAYGKKSDVWALGLFLYELCTLRHAFDAATLPALIMKILKGAYPPVPAAYSPQLHALISMMLQLSPNKRPNIAQILRLEFVRTRLERLARKDPLIKQHWETSMKLNTRKELFLANRLPAAAAPAPTPSPAPMASPATKRRSQAPQPAASSHKPVAASATKRAPATRASSSAAAAVATPSRKVSTRSSTPPVLPVPALPPSVAASDDEEDDESDDEDEEVEPEPVIADARSPPRGGIITAGWFDRAAEEYELLMRNLGGGSDEPEQPQPPAQPTEDDMYDDEGPSALPAIPAAVTPVNAPSTPRRKPAAARGSGGPSSSIKPPPPASTRKPAAAPSKRRSEGGASLAVKTPGPKASPKAPSSAASSDELASTAAGIPSSLQAMMAELEDQKARAREWKRAHANERAAKRAAELESIAKHKAQLKAIKSRASLALAPPSSAKDEDDPLATVPPSRARSEPPGAHAGDEVSPAPSAPASSRAMVSPARGKKGSVASALSPASVRSPTAAARSPLKAGGGALGAFGKKKVGALSPSPSSRASDASSATSTPEKAPAAERVSVRAFISARKKEAAASGPSTGPVIDLVLQAAPRKDQPDVQEKQQRARADQPSPVLIHEDSGSSVGSGPASTKAALSHKSAKKPPHHSHQSSFSRAPAREINFELVLQSSAQAQAQAQAQAAALATPVTPAVPFSVVPAQRTPVVAQSPPASASASSSAGPAVSPSSSHQFPVEYAAVESTSGTSPSPPPAAAAAAIVSRPQSGAPVSSPSASVSAASSRPQSGSFNVAVAISPFLSPSSSVAAGGSISPPSSAAGSLSGPARAAQLSYQITQARGLCCSMLGVGTFERAYSYLRDCKVRKGVDPSVPSEKEQEVTVKSWFASTDQHTAYNHIASLIFCEDLMAKMESCFPRRRESSAQARMRVAK